VLAALAVAVAALAAGGTYAASQRSGGGDDLDVAIAGDSFMDLSRAQFRAHADQLGMANDISAYGGTAACDWKKEVTAYAKRHPRVLILSFGGNDLTACMLRTPEPSTPDQTAAEYETDLRTMVAGVEDTSPDTKIYMVPPPPVRDPQFEANAAAMRAMYARFGGDHPEITLIDVTPELGPDHQFHASLPCEPWEQTDCGPDGTIVLRTDDGIHLTPAGGERYARALLAGIGAKL
jgi:lysophospholipase L1-like esterase